MPIDIQLTWQNGLHIELKKLKKKIKSKFGSSVQVPDRCSIKKCVYNRAKETRWGEIKKTLTHLPTGHKTKQYKNSIE